MSSPKYFVRNKDGKKISRKQFVTQWIKDLESGNFRQLTDVLSTDTPKNGKHKYCCMGVACVVGQKLGIEDASFSDGSQCRNDGEPGSWFHKLVGDTQIKVVSKKSGFKLPISTTFAGANDDEGATFKEIAKGLRTKYRIS